MTESANQEPDGVKGVIGQVIEVLEDWLKTGQPKKSAARAAWSAEYKWMAEELIKLLKNPPSVAK